jgi:hypothetical protein
MPSGSLLYFEGFDLAVRKSDVVRYVSIAQSVDWLLVRRPEFDPRQGYGNLRLSPRLPALRPTQPAVLLPGGS